MPDLIDTSDRTDIEQVPEDDFVKPTDGPDKGYWGYSPETDRDQYTVAGVTGGTAKTSDKPDAAAKSRAEKSYEALKGSKP